eukprot:TRINITY_DN1368_c0_g1_i2.p1 TRINITY_DN1368_c0_g1~~TRINITY_DN1368_c0_g1_i2.p1  ORF type:complete len:824 (+),score=113.49 TRINITY_DN1368_c0_g1_i2:659-3130(+)
MSKQPFTSNSLPPVAGRASSFTEGVTIDPVHLLGRDASAYSDVSGPATVSDHVASPLYVGALPLGSHTSIENEDANPPFITRPSELPSQRRTNRRQESQNLFTRIFNRKRFAAKPGTQYHQARRMYENIVPNHTIQDVTAPAVHLKRFTSNGQYLIAFSRSLRDVILYRYKGTSGPLKREGMGNIASAPSPSLVGEPIPNSPAMASSGWMNVNASNLSTASQGGSPALSSLHGHPSGSAGAGSSNGAGPSGHGRAGSSTAGGSGSGGGSGNVRTQQAPPPPVATPSLPSSRRHSVTRNRSGNVSFDHFFEQVYSKTVTGENEVLAKEFLVTVCDSKYMIIASHGHSDDTVLPSNALPGITEIDNYQFRLVHIPTGEISDTIVFPNDKIHLSHNWGVSLHSNRFAVLSVLTQTVHVFHIKESGVFIPVHSLGENCFDDDRLVLDRAKLEEENWRRQREIALQALARERSSQRAAAAAGCSAGSMGGPGTAGTSDDDDEATLLPDPLATGFGGDKFLQNFSIQPADDISDPSMDGGGGGGGGGAGGGGGPDGGDGAGGNGGRNADAVPRLAGIKHRFLAFLNEQARRTGPQALSKFYYLFKQYESLVIWKVQFLDERHLLIKYGNVDGVLGKMADCAGQTAFFVVYAMETATVLAVFDNTSEELMKIYEDYLDFFLPRPTDLPLSLADQISSSNNQHVRAKMRKSKHLVMTSKNGGLAQAIRRALLPLPAHPQSVISTPFLDQTLFSYDDKWVSSTDRPKPCAEFPVKFHSRSTHAVRFKIAPGRGRSRSTKRIVSYLFHPILPFVITLELATGHPAVMSFHYRK